MTPIIRLRIFRGIIFGLLEPLTEGSYWIDRRYVLHRLGEYRVGGGIAPAVLPHHRAYGSVPRRFMRLYEDVATVCAEPRVQVQRRTDWDKRRSSAKS